MKKLIVPTNQASFVSNRGNRLTCDASDLGISARYLVHNGWPELIELNGKTFGRRMPKHDRENELVSMEYRASDGTLLELWND